MKLSVPAPMGEVGCAALREYVKAAVRLCLSICLHLVASAVPGTAGGGGGGGTRRRERERVAVRRARGPAQGCGPAGEGGATRPVGKLKPAAGARPNNGGEPSKPCFLLRAANPSHWLFFRWNVQLSIRWPAQGDPPVLYNAEASTVSGDLRGLQVTMAT